MHLSDTVDFLLGTWRLERAFDDDRSGRRGRFAGTATLTARALDRSLDRSPGALYAEVGELRFGDYRGPASRHLRYTRIGDGAAALHFTDGRPFVDLDLRSGEWRSIHRCGEDRYEITTTVRSPEIVHEHWRVRGPAKNYAAVTILRRATG